MTPEEQEMARLRAAAGRSKVAQSTAVATPIAPAGKPGAPAMQGGGQSPLMQAGMMIGKKLLGSALGPVGGVLGGLFNEGGQVQQLNQGGWLSGLFGPGKPRTSRTFGEASKAPRTMTTGQQRQQQPKQQRTPWWQNPNRQKMKAAGYNRGGKVGPLNPHGYNEGGAVTETPIKKVMDEQKLDQQAVAFERDETRKEQKHVLDMKLKQQQFELAQKQKKEAAMTKKKPTAPLAR